MLFLRVLFSAQKGMALAGQWCLKYSAVCSSTYNKDGCILGKRVGTWAYLGTLPVYPNIEKARAGKAQEEHVSVGKNRLCDTDQSLAVFVGVGRTIPVSHRS